MKCYKCKQYKDSSSFYKDPSRHSGFGSMCKPCTLVRSIERRRTRKQEIISHYGGRCACCGESIMEFLSVDHMNNDGHRHRKETKTQSGDVFYRWIIRNNFPNNLQILCFNCNCAKGFFGRCPHMVAVKVNG